MTRRTVVGRLLAGIGVLVVLGLGFAAVRRVQQRSAAHQAQAVYYCPMHPTYTSDRPGDCPICNMRLVKREETMASHQPSAVSRQQKHELKDICYMHNCPMLKPGQQCPMLVMAKKGEPVTCPICGTHVAEAAPPPQSKKILYWTDPMIPGYKSDKPGKSPMGMDLVPVYQEAVAGATSGASPVGYAPILVTPQKQQMIGVTTAPAATRSLTKTIRTAGRIAYDPELYQAEEEYLQALNAWLGTQASGEPDITQQAARLVEAARMRLRLLGVSEALMADMARWEGPDQRLLLADPQGGVWLYAPVYEYELPLVAVGQTIAVEVPAVPGKRLEGIIRSIDPVLDPATRAARVRAVLTDPDKLLKPEMYVNASIVVPVGDVLAIPAEAVFDTGLRQVVFVDKGQGLFEPRDVTVGIKADGLYELKGGVAEGERVVTSGNFLIDSESRLKAALEGLTPSTDAGQESGAQHHEH